MGRLSQWDQCDQKSLYKKDAGVSERKRFEDLMLLALRMGEGVMNQRDAGRHWS